jgi:hypothetical protein
MPNNSSDSHSQRNHFYAGLASGISMPLCTEEMESASGRSKAEIEDQYETFVAVNDDAIVEGVDRVTERVGCSASYSADLEGLAGKVSDEGATGRAQVLIRQMS